MSYKTIGYVAFLKVHTITYTIIYTFTYTFFIRALNTTHHTNLHTVCGYVDKKDLSTYPHPLPRIFHITTLFYVKR
jgi:hypothetical protein